VQKKKLKRKKYFLFLFSEKAEMSTKEKIDEKSKTEITKIDEDDMIWTRRFYIFYINLRAKI